MKVIERDGRTFIERRLSADRTDLLEVRRQSAPNGDEYLNLAAWALDFNQDIHKLFRWRQTKRCPANDGKSLPLHLLTVETSSGRGRRSCRVPFILRSDAARLTPERSATPCKKKTDRFLWEGKWVRAKWSLFELFHVPRGRPAHRAFKKYLPAFERVLSPITGHWVQIVREEALFAGLRAIRLIGNCRRSSREGPQSGSVTFPNASIEHGRGQTRRTDGTTMRWRKTSARPRSKRKRAVAIWVGDAFAPPGRKSIRSACMSMRGTRRRFSPRSTPSAWGVCRLAETVGCPVPRSADGSESA